MLAIVVEAVVRVGKRALKNRTMIALAAAAFVAIFFFAVPFPIIIIAAGVIGYAGARAGRPEFAPASHSHGGSSAAATLGGLLATWVTFTPCFLWIFVGAPYIERLRGALGAITAAVVGVILNLSI